MGDKTAVLEKVENIIACVTELENLYKQNYERENRKNQFIDCRKKRQTKGENRKIL